MSLTPRVIAITGATGFTGPFVVRELRSLYPDARLKCLVRRTSDTAEIRRAGAELIAGDLRDQRSLRAAFEGSDTLVNVASLGFDWVDPLLQAVKAAAIRRGVFFSTTAIFTRLPVRSRPARERAEALVGESGIDWTILRPTMIYGTPRDRNMARLIRFVLKSPVVPIVAPDALHQPVHVQDVAAAVGRVLETGATIGRSYNLAGREPMTFEQLVRRTIAATGCRCRVLRLPFGPGLAAAVLYNAVATRPRITVEQVRRLREDKHVDYAAASGDFGFGPRSFEEGIRQEVQMILAASGRGSALTVCP